jgi:sugar phosphate isomerase/epimerase
MKLIYFTKMLKGLNAEEIAATAQSLGVDGLDLAIRAGQSVNPDNVASALPKAMAVWRKAGLIVPLATLEGNAIDADMKGLEPLFAACAEHGVRELKLGYWLWKQGTWSGAQLSYWRAVDQIRTALAKFERFGEKFGVRSLVHTHCDNYYALNASAARHLVSGFNPKHVGIFLDPAHLSVNGEPLPMAIDIAGEYLHMVAAKSVRWILQPGEPAAPATWKHDWCQLSEGLVNWPDALKTFQAAGYNGPITVHGEYSGPEVLPEILERVKKDVAFLRSAAHGLTPNP